MKNAPRVKTHCRYRLKNASKNIWGCKNGDDSGYELCQRTERKCRFDRTKAHSKSKIIQIVKNVLSTRNVVYATPNGVNKIASAVQSVLDNDNQEFFMQIKVKTQARPKSVSRVPVKSAPRASALRQIVPSAEPLRTMTHAQPKSATHVPVHMTKRVVASRQHSSSDDSSSDRESFDDD